MWLANIHENKVKEEVRPKLVRYQQECAKVLADHFFKKAEQPNTSALLTAMLSRLDALEGRMLAAPVVHIPVQATPRFTIRERLAWKGWCDTSRAQRKKIYKLAVAKLDARHDETPCVAGGPGGGGPCRFHGHQLACLDEAIDEVREIYLKRDMEAVTLLNVMRDRRSNEAA